MNISFVLPFQCPDEDSASVLNFIFRINWLCFADSNAIKYVVTFHSIYAVIYVTVKPSPETSRRPYQIHLRRQTMSNIILTQGFSGSEGTCGLEHYFFWRIRDSNENKFSWFAGELFCIWLFCILQVLPSLIHFLRSN